MKRLISFFLFAILFCFSITVSAHPGRTDSKGGHTDRVTGEYHYHHGQPAHQHYDVDGDGMIDCPYMFNNQSEKQGDHSNLSFWLILVSCYVGAAVLFMPFALLNDHLKATRHDDAASLIEGIPVFLWIISFPLSELIRRLIKKYRTSQKNHK